jgi:O-antigen/teichoic acid export membrane protein
VGRRPEIHDWGAGLFLRSLTERWLVRLGLGSTIARNSMLLIGAQVLAQGINTVVAIFLARFLEDERSGILRFVTMYSLLFTVLAELGLTRSAIQQMARGEKAQVGSMLGHMVVLRIFSSMVFIAVLWASLVLPGNSSRVSGQEKYLIMLFSCSAVCQAFRRNSEAVFQGTERMHYQAVFLVVNRTLTAICIFGVLWFHGRDALAATNSPETFRLLSWIVGAYCFTDFADCVWSWVAARRLARPVYSWDWKPKLSLLKAGWPFALQILAGQIYYYIGNPMLNYLAQGSPEFIKGQIGCYAVAYSVVLVLIMIPVNITQALFPPMSRAYHEQNHVRLFSLFRYGFGLLILVGTPLAALLYLFSGEMVTLLYGRSFDAAIPMMKILAWSLVFSFINVPLSNLLAASDRQKFVNIAVFSGAAFTIVLNYLLIPKYSGIGASFSTMLTEGFCLLITASLVFWKYARHVFSRILMAIISVQIVGVALCLSVGGSPLALRVVCGMLFLAINSVGVIALMSNRRMKLPEPHTKTPKAD